MGKRIYNGRSGVTPVDPALRQQNREANARVRANLLPEIRARLEALEAADPYFRGRSFDLYDVTDQRSPKERQDAAVKEQLKKNVVANSLGLGKGGKAGHRPGKGVSH